MVAAEPSSSSSVAAPVQVRRFPYPYRAMLAICSDLDETPDLETYLEQLRFLNTSRETSLGAGVALEVGNSMFFDMPAGHFSYWNTSDQGRVAIRALIRSGHIDCLHSFGDVAVSRAAVERSLHELERHDCRFKVWVDHAVAPTNFGADIMQGHGDQPGHPAYHADLTVAHGIEYVWCGRVTSVIGQDRPASLRPTFRAQHALTSTRTVAKEFAKQCLAHAGNSKYALHATNATLRPVRLRDGQPVWEFLRCNPHWGGVSVGDTGVGIADVLQPEFLDALVEREGSCVLYTHLGKLSQGGARGFGPQAITAFRRLREYTRAGKILVTTTARLLGYTRAKSSVEVNSEMQGEEIRVDVRRSRSGSAPLDGLTFYADTRRRITVTVDNMPATDVTLNPADHTGGTSLSFAWPALKFPGLE